MSDTITTSVTLMPCTVPPMSCLCMSTCEHSIVSASGRFDIVKQRLLVLLQVIKIMGGRTRNNRLEQLLPALVFTTFLQMGLTNVKGNVAVTCDLCCTPSLWSEVY